MTMLSLPLVSTCSIDGCSYNHDSDCHAGAITVSEGTGGCVTFLDISEKGGTEISAQVGACHRAECVHNSAFECGAESISIGAGADLADCRTFALA